MKKALSFIVFLLLAIACQKNEVELTVSSELKSYQEETKSISFCDSMYIIKDTLSWRKLSGDEKLKACQLTDLTLDTISTSDLVKTCFNYPLYFEFSLTNDEEKSISYMIDSYNGLTELSKRSDGAKELMELYSEIPVMSENNKYNSDEPGMPFRLRYLELLLTNSKFMRQLDEAGKESLITLFEKKRKEKLNNPEIYGNYSTENISGYIKKILIIQEAVKYYFLGTIYVYTPFRKSVTGDTYTDFTSTEKYYATKNVLDNYNVVLLDSATPKYNCHSYAWNLSNGGDTCWIEATIQTLNDNLSKYWTNDLYSTPKPNNSYGYTRVFYYNGDHSALSPYASYQYTSKWGSGPLVRHSPTEVPSEYDPSHRTYYGNPGINGEEYIILGNTYAYMVLPNMNYATYSWRIEEDDDRYSIVSQSGNTAYILFTRGGTFPIYCDIYNSYSELVYTAFLEPLNGDY